jgi:hypothetical protein
MEKHKSGYVRHYAIGGVVGCPGDYIPGSPRQHGKECITSCWACWDREMPENTDCRVADAPRNDEPKDDLVKDDPVNHPRHYTAGGVECIDAIAAALCKYTDGVDAWLAGQVIKYLWRSPLKNAYKQDLGKAKFYLDRLVKRQEEKP